MDLKPSNVLIAGDGLPVLLDFHLARHPVRQGVSVTGRLGRPPRPMSPEQSDAVEATRQGRPASHPVDGRCDIYALGLLLAEAPDGSPVKAAEPCSLSRWKPGNPAVPLGLTDIVRRCLAADPAARYPTAAALAEDLRRHLDDLPLKGVPNRSPRERRPNGGGGALACPPASPWARWARHDPGRPGDGTPSEARRRGQGPRDRIVNAILWILRTGAPWRDPPGEYGPWGTAFIPLLVGADERVTGGGGWAGGLAGRPGRGQWLS